MTPPTVSDALALTPARIDGRPHVADEETLSGLLLRTAEGDQTAFEEFVRRTRNTVFASIQAVVRSVEIGEDAAQEVYLQVWNRAGQFDPARGSAIGWLLTIARRRAVDQVRTEQSHRNRHARFVSANYQTDHDVVAEAVSRTLERDAVNLHLLSLTALQLAAINLAYFGGLTYLEVSTNLKVPLPTVKSRIRDSIVKLRKVMADGTVTPTELEATLT